MMPFSVRQLGKIHSSEAKILLLMTSPRTHRRIAFLLFFCLLTFVPAPAQQTPPARDTAAAGIAAKMDEYLTAHARQGRFSGSVLVARNGQPVFSRGYGMANLEHDVPNTAQTKHRLGSITKQFTAMAVMMLQERGRLSVSDSICRHLADCPPAWQPITIHHLLTHTSGIPSYTDFPDFGRSFYRPYTHAEMVASFRNLPLQFAPGTRFRYNNSGYFLLGLIIERLSGMPYENFLRESIFAPLGMTNTGYDRHERVLRHRATGYAVLGDAPVTAAYVDMSQPYAAGALYSTTEDLLKWEQALYTERLVPRRALDAIFTAPEPAPQGAPPGGGGYAYGWAVGTLFNRRFFSHGGGIPGFSTFIARYPEDRVTVIVLSNLESAPSGAIARDLAAIVFDQPYEIPRERPVANVDPSVYDAYVGEYQLAPNFILTITRDGNRLLTQATGQPQVEIFPESETRFFLRVVEAQITFVRNEQGQVTGLILHQGGRDMPARKIK